MTSRKKVLLAIVAIAATLVIAAGIFFGSAAMLGIDLAALSYDGGTVKDDGEGGGEAEDYEFVFNGTADIAEQTYHVTLYGNKDEEQSISLRIEELPTAELTGTWVFVEQKGYKIYFDDANGSFVYTKYDPASKLFSFNYNLNIGDTNGGSGKVAFTCEDEAFAAEYDGEGLGNVPPTFNGYTTYIGAMFALGEPMQCVLTCYEDGSCVSLSTNEVKFASERRGTWEFDEDANVYTFTFEDEPFGINEETGSSTYWKFNQTVGECSMEDAAANWTFMGGTGVCYWDQTTITEAPGNTFSTVYDEDTNTYYLLFEHGISGFGEFADRYVSWSPDEA